MSELVGINEQRDRRRSAAVDLLVFGLPSLLFLCAPVQNRPLRTETPIKNLRPDISTVHPSRLRLAAPRPFGGGSSPLTIGGRSPPC